MNNNEDFLFVCANDLFYFVLIFVKIILFFNIINLIIQENLELNAF